MDQEKDEEQNEESDQNNQGSYDQIADITQHQEMRPMANEPK